MCRNGRQRLRGAAISRWRTWLPPALPCGGVGESGFGRIHGPDGLKEFTFAKSITRQRFKPIMQLTSFARDTKTDGTVALMMMVLHGGKKTLK
jgi:aldehyde dehydrogenase (NAD+)